VSNIDSKTESDTHDRFQKEARSDSIVA
jgi:hypothetical protein